MRRRPHLSQLLCLVLAAGQAVGVLGCSDRIRGSGSGSGSTVAGILAQRGLGELVFQLYRDSLAAQPQGPSRDAQLAVLDGRRAEFVAAVDAIATPQALQGVGPAADALFALVDDGTLPLLAEHVASALDALRGDPQALTALVDLLRSGPNLGAAITRAQALELLGRTANFSETQDVWLAVAQLVAENDGVDDQGQPNGEPDLVRELLALASRSLGSAPASPSTAQQAALDRLAAFLAGPADLRGQQTLGPPEWLVRLDGRGLPRVAVDPATGRLPAPFVDGDADGLADCDAAGRFLDAGGLPFELPALGAPGAPGYDADGRAVGPGGLPLYETYDAKGTVLAAMLRALGELLARDALGLGSRVAQAALGARLPDGSYGTDHPLAELAWGLVEAARGAPAPRALRALTELLQRDPSGAERLLLGASRALEASRRARTGQPAAGGGLSDPQNVQLVDDLLRLADDLFEQPGLGPSTARTVMDTLADLRRRAPDFGAQLAPLLVFARVERELSPDADRNLVDESRSQPVDFNLPAGLSNRSAIQQLLDLLARADGCQLFGRRLSVWILDLMADRSPQTVGTLAQAVVGLPGGLQNLLCSGLSQDIQALDALAQSGALDGLLPLAKAFKDRGELDLLVRLLVRLQRGYASVRPAEAGLARALDAGVLDELQGLLDQARSVLDPHSGQSLADALADGIALLVDDDAPLFDRRGQPTPSRAHLLLRPLQELDRRVRAAGLSAETTALRDALGEVLLARVQVNGQELLQNGSLLPLLREALEVLAPLLPDDPAARDAELDQARDAALQTLSSPGLGTAVALLDTLERSPAKPLLRRALVNLLTPRATRADDAYGAVCRLLVALSSHPLPVTALGGLAPVLARVLDPAQPLVPGALRAFQRLVTADQGQALLGVVRGALSPGPGGRIPADLLLEVVDQVNRAGSGAASLDAASLGATLAEVSRFIRDPAGLGSLFDRIRQRQRP